MASTSAIVMNRKNRLNSTIVNAMMKKTLPLTPLRTSAVTSALASSTSDRNKVEKWVAASRTSSPSDASASCGNATGDSGTEGSPVGGSGLACRPWRGCVLDTCDMVP